MSFIIKLARAVLPLSWRRWLNRRWGTLPQNTDQRLLPIPDEMRYGNKLDIFVFAASDGGQAGEQQYRVELAGSGHRVFRFCASGVQLEKQGGGSMRGADTVPQAPDKSMCAMVEAAINEHAVEEAVCIVQHPAWAGAVNSFKRCFSWPIVVDSFTFNKFGYGNCLEAMGTCPGYGERVIELEHPIRSLDMEESAWNRIHALYGRTSIIIVSFNSLDLLKQCVQSILNRTIYPNYEIIIVDNNSMGSVKDYLAELRGKEDRVRVVFNRTNKGFAAANNMGLKLAGNSEFVVLLNNDTVVPRGWLCRLLRHARRAEVGMVGPVTNWTGNEAKIDAQYNDANEMEHFVRTYTRAHEGQSFDIKVLAMYCVALRKAVVDQVGPLDDIFGLGMFEDEDYAYRIREKGLSVICAEDVFVHHYGMASFSRLEPRAYKKLFEQNRRKFENKWKRPWVPHQAR